MEKSQKIVNDQADWGALYMPRVQKTFPTNALRVAVFTSTNSGVLLLDSLARFETRFPDSLMIVGIATDDPLCENSRISAKKRIWRHYTPEEMEHMVNGVLAIADDHEVPCYTGNVKTEYFRQLLLEWNPDAIIMNCFGQKIDASIYELPDLGMYNFHPSDLAQQVGAGAEPFESTMSSGEATSVMTLHHVAEDIDAGSIVGVSPRIRITTEDDTYPEDVRNLQAKIPSVCAWMGIELIQELIKNNGLNNPKPIDSIDFAGTMHVPLGELLMQPVCDDLQSYVLPLHPSIV
jgi:folate-dependent phosphoribosylglycinamide formyltransferase PurN